MIDLERLNDHSRQFAKLLFKQWPGWIQYARFDPYEDFEKEALLVEVPRPVDGSSHGLYITTSEWEISVGFGENFHTRFGASGEKGEGDFYHQAIRFISNFVEGDFVLATAYQGKEWLGAWKIDLREESLEKLEIEEGVMVRIRSWDGRADCDLEK